MVKSISILLSTFLFIAMIQSCGDSDSGTNLTGNILTCQGASTSDAFAIVMDEEEWLYFEANNEGNFDIDLTDITATTFTLRLVDREDYFYTETQVNVDNSTELGDFTLCDSSEEYFYFEIESEDFNYKTFSIDASMSMGLTGNAIRFQLLPELITGPFGAVEFTQEIVLDQNILGGDEDGWNQRLFQIMDGDYVFRFSDKGPLNADGIESYIVGMFEASRLEGDPDAKLFGSFKLLAD